MSKTNVKPICVLVLSMIMCFGLLAGCGGELLPLATEFDEAEVKSVAEHVITLINEQDTEGLKEISTEQVKADLTDVTLKKLYETIGEGGAFEEVKEMKVQGGTENDKNYAVVTAETEYENKSFTYTITITTDMKLVGLRYK
jgi:hypothetical protein